MTATWAVWGDSEGEAGPDLGNRFACRHKHNPLGNGWRSGILGGF